MGVVNGLLFLPCSCDSIVMTSIGVCDGEIQPLVVDGVDRGELQWPDAAIGSRVILDCPCPQATTTRQASRVCAGDLSTGGRWMEANLTACYLQDLAWKLCYSKVSQAHAGSIPL